MKRFTLISHIQPQTHTHAHRRTVWAAQKKIDLLLEIFRTCLKTRDVLSGYFVYSFDASVFGRFCLTVSIYPPFYHSPVPVLVLLSNIYPFQSELPLSAGRFFFHLSYWTRLQTTLLHRNAVCRIQLLYNIVDFERRLINWKIWNSVFDERNHIPNEN